MIVREGTGSDAVLLVTGTDVLASIGVNPIEISVTASAFALLLYSLEDDTAVFAAHAEGTVALSGISVSRLAAQLNSRQIRRVSR